MLAFVTSAPFTTSTLQQEAGRKLRFNARRTMRVAQSLYENGYITYMRTDSTTLSKEAIGAARNLVSSEYGQDCEEDGGAHGSSNIALEREYESAALLLERRGVNVHVLEASDGVGGRIRTDIRSALKRITNDDLGSDPKNWRNWWTKEKQRHGGKPPPGGFRG